MLIKLPNITIGQDEFELRVDDVELIKFVLSQSLVLKKFKSATEDLDANYICQRINDYDGVIRTPQCAFNFKMTFNLQGWIYSLKQNNRANKSSLGFLINVKPGYLDFTSSRESIDMTDKSKLFIATMFKAITSKEYIVKLVQTLSDIEPQKILKYDLSSAFCYRLSECEVFFNMVCNDNEDAKFLSDTVTSTVIKRKSQSNDRIVAIEYTSRKGLLLSSLYNKKNIFKIVDNDEVLNSNSKNALATVKAYAKLHLKDNDEIILLPANSLKTDKFDVYADKLKHYEDIAAEVKEHRRQNRIISQQNTPSNSEIEGINEVNEKDFDRILLDLYNGHGAAVTSVFGVSCINTQTKAEYLADIFNQRKEKTHPTLYVATIKSLKKVDFQRVIDTLKSFNKPICITQALYYSLREWNRKLVDDSNIDVIRYNANPFDDLVYCCHRDNHNYYSSHRYFTETHEYFMEINGINSEKKNNTRLIVSKVVEEYNKLNISEKLLAIVRSHSQYEDKNLVERVTGVVVSQMRYDGFKTKIGDFWDNIFDDRKNVRRYYSSVITRVMIEIYKDIMGEQTITKYDKDMKKYIQTLECATPSVSFIKRVYSNMTGGNKSKLLLDEDIKELEDEAISSLLKKIDEKLSK